MNFGSGTAYMGVQATIRALDTANASSATFATYDRYNLIDPRSPAP